jgi:hypothetical protein
MSEFIIEIFKLLFWLIFSAFLTWSGEIVLFVFTFGKHQPRWDLYTKEKPVNFVVFSEASFWIGATFWVAVIGQAPGTT